MSIAYEERKWERRKVSMPMRARRDSGEDLGLVTEFGIKGLCIRGRHSLTLGELLTLHIDLPASVAQTTPFVVAAECRWSDAQDEAGVFDSGVKFRLDSAEQIDVLRKVLDSCTRP